MTDANDGWTMRKKGCAHIHTHPKVERAVVDRRGFGITAAVAGNVTWEGTSFPGVAEAKAAALAKTTTEGGDVRCRTCGEAYSPYGDGWDGECPDCADRTFQEECPEDLDDGEIAG